MSTPQSEAQAASLTTLDPESLVKLVHQLQLQNSELHRRSLEAETHLARSHTGRPNQTSKSTSSNQEKPGSAGPGPKPLPSKSSLVIELGAPLSSEGAQVLARCARTYCFLYAPWADIADIPDRRPTVDRESMERWTGDWSIGAGADIFDLVPAECHPLLVAHKSYFVATVNRHRAQLLNSVKNRLERILRDWPDVLRAITKKDYQDPAIQRLLKNNDGKWRSVPLCFYPADKKGNSAHLYRVVELTLIGNIIVWGKSSVDNPEAKGKRNSSGGKLNLTHSTLGFVLFCALMLHFIMSGQTNFTQQGSAGIKWWLQFRILRARAGCKMAKGGHKAEQIKRLLQWWDAAVFDVAPSGASAGGSDAEGLLEEDEEALLAWDDPYDESEDEEEPMHPDVIGRAAGSVQTNRRYVEVDEVESSTSEGSDFDLEPTAPPPPPQHSGVDAISRTSAGAPAMISQGVPIVADPSALRAPAPLPAPSNPTSHGGSPVVATSASDPSVRPQDTPPSSPSTVQSTTHASKSLTSISSPTPLNDQVRTIIDRLSSAPPSAQPQLHAELSALLLHLQHPSSCEIEVPSRSNELSVTASGATTTPESSSLNASASPVNNADMPPAKPSRSQGSGKAPRKKTVTVMPVITALVADVPEQHHSPLGIETPTVRRSTRNATGTKRGTNKKSK